MITMVKLLSKWGMILQVGGISPSKVLADARAKPNGLHPREQFGLLSLGERIRWKENKLKLGLFEKSRGFEVGLKFVGTKTVELLLTLVLEQC